jgi:PPOX class probable F420-dependent enzyme
MPLINNEGSTMSPLPVSTHRLFESDLHATLVTINTDGSPQLSLVWVTRDGDELLVGMEGSRQKTKNIRRDPRISLLIEDTADHADADYGLRQYLLVHGTATLDGPDIAEKFTALMDTQAGRYLGTERYELPNRASSTAVIARIRPHRISGNGPWA